VGIWLPVVIDSHSVWTFKIGSISCFRPDGQSLPVAVRTNQAVDLALEKLLVHPIWTKLVRSAAFSPDRQSLLPVAVGQHRSWNLTLGKLSATLWALEGIFPLLSPMGRLSSSSKGQHQAFVESCIGNYCTILSDIQNQFELLFSSDGQTSQVVVG